MSRKIPLQNYGLVRADLPTFGSVTFAFRLTFACQRRSFCLCEKEQQS